MDHPRSLQHFQEQLFDFTVPERKDATPIAFDIKARLAAGFDRFASNTCFCWDMFLAASNSR